MVLYIDLEIRLSNSGAPLIGPAPFCYYYYYYSILRVTFKDTVNQGVVNGLVKEVQAVNPTFLACHIRSKWMSYIC